MFTCIKMDFVLNNLQRLMCHKTQTKTNFLSIRKSEKNGPGLLYIFLKNFSFQKCYFCSPKVKQNGKSGSCAQCSSGRCTLSFHITCAHAAGVMFETSDWPFPIYITCQKHSSHKEKVSNFINLFFIMPKNLPMSFC